MIRISLAAKPAEFDKNVRLPGLSALAEMVGEPPLIKRPGPKRVKRAERREDIPAADFPDYWTLAQNDLLQCYERRCAFLACYIEPATGLPSTDHMVPKSKAWDKVYEWDNYRLAAHLMNTLKSDRIPFLDPFEIQDDWIGLELVDFGVFLREAFPDKFRKHADNTLPVLNQRDCRQLRKEYVEEYRAGEITLLRLARRSPFVARELRRQGFLLPADK